MRRISLISIGKPFFARSGPDRNPRTGAQNGAESALRWRVEYFGD
jgi:hypothetical protein